MNELEIIRHQHISGISVFFDTVEYRTPHFHPEWELIWLTSGSLTVQCSRRRVAAGKGDLLLFAPNQVHEFTMQDGPATFLCLQVSPHSFDLTCPELRAVTIARPDITAYLTAQQRQRVYGALRELMARYLGQEPFYALGCTALCADLLGLLLPLLPIHRMTPEEQTSADKRSARLARFLAFVDENYRAPIRLADFAAAEGCSVSYLSRFLKENLNQTFQEYVSGIRFHAACRMMRSGGMRMLDVCEAAGFSDYRYFSQCFKAYAGMTPEAYSRSLPALPSGEKQTSVYSRERFYTREESEEMLRSL